MMIIDYANADDDGYCRPQLGVDFSNLFMPLVNFVMLGVKFLTSLDEQANVLFYL